jgi:hypothetical protein
VTSGKRIAALAAALVTLSYDAAAEPSPVTADPAPESLRLLSTARCTTEGGSEIELAPGRYLPEPVWLALDGEARRLQDAETRLGAENRSLRESARPRYGTAALVLGALAAGIAVGWKASQ